RSGDIVVGCTAGAASGRPCAAAASGAARLEELHIVGDDLGHAPLLSALAFPRAVLDAAFDEDEGAFPSVLGDRLGQVSLTDRVRNDVVVVGELLALAVRTGRP